MKLSYNWIKQYISCDLDADKAAELLTDSGLEVEKIQHTGLSKEKMEGIVVGEVLEKTKHPNADRLNITKVNIGNGEPLSIVCGAPNVDKGQKVVVATVGSKLYPTDGDSFKIKKSKIRGEVSLGMICAEDEIGVGHDHDGIMVLPEDTQVGMPIIDYFGENSDTVFEIGLTPNRIDGASHFGAARDLAAVINAKNKEATQARLPEIDIEFPANAQNPTVEIKDTKLCPRYAALKISGAEVKPSPEWLQERLRSIGLSPINNIVDVTNFVLHETGHPLHAFDCDRLKGGGVRIQTLKANTKFTTLDEVTRELSEHDLMICDLEDNPLCIAGVFGGQNSGVTEDTKTVLIESAYFNPVSVRKTAKRHGLNTDASFRFERGADPDMVLYALQRAAQLMCELSGAKVDSDIVDEFPYPFEKAKIDFPWNEFNRYAGFDVETEKLIAILEDLDFEVEDNPEIDGATLTAPLYRVDVTRPCDVVEELMRVIGYNEIPFPDKLNASLSYSQKPDKYATKEKISDFLSARGFSEIMCNSLTAKKHVEKLNPESASKLVDILNPLSSDLNILRSTMLYNGLDAIRYNLNRKNERILFYEFGHTYLKQEKGYREDEFIALFLSGDAEIENWSTPQEKFSFYHLKKEVLNTIARLGIPTDGLNEKALEAPGIEDGIRLMQGKKTLAHIGWVDKKTAQHFDIDVPVFYAELFWDELFEMLRRDDIHFQPVPKYPEVRRDFSLLLDKEVKFATIAKIAGQKGKKLLRAVNLFDVYEGKNLPEGKKSYAVSFTLRDDQATLTDEIVDGIMDDIRKQLESELKAQLR